MGDANRKPYMDALLIGIQTSGSSIFLFQVARGLIYVSGAGTSWGASLAIKPHPSLIISASR